MVWILLILGLAALTLGAEFLVRGSSRLAALIGIAPLVIGLTIVAFGTSSPELIVSTRAAINNQADISVGNVVGSNIFNVLFILGLCALIAPLKVSSKLVSIDVPIMIGTAFLLHLSALDGLINHIEGLAFVLLLIAYTAISFIKGSRDSAVTEELQELGVRPNLPKNSTNFLKNLALTGGGLLLLVLGGKWLVDSAVQIARMLGVSEMVIGLTIVAAGTSLPEVATSVMATLKNEREIAIGNVVGSNIFNILMILGLSSFFQRDGLVVNPEMMSFDIPIMIFISAICWPIFFTGLEISRWEGAILFGYYVAYTAFLVFKSAESPLLTPLTIIVSIIVPITTLLILRPVFQKTKTAKKK